MTACYHDDGFWFLTGRHQDHPEGWEGECPGCVPCPEAHCGDCQRRHVGYGEATCPECISRTRTALRDLLDLYAALPEEAEERGVASEAANLFGPAADAEAFSHRRVSVMAGRIPGPLLDEDDKHPLSVLGRWVFMLGEDYGDPTSLKLTMSRAVDYLDRRLGRVAHDVGQDWGLFSREVRRCKAHMEAVLHDGEQRDTGAPCMTCSVPLVRVWGADDKADGWQCPRCHRRSTEAQYRFAVQHLHREEATHLTDHDMEIRTGVKAGTVRVWAKRGDVGRRRDSGRVVYSVADVEKKIRAQAS